MKNLLIGILTLANTVLGFAQNFNQDLDNAFSDVLFVTGKFVDPAAEASVYLTSSSWATSAKSLSKFKVDFSVNANVLPISNNRKNILVSNSDFKSFVIRGGEESASVPSALGGDSTTFYDFTIGGQEYEMQSFDGVKTANIVYPYMQASVGLWGETELTVRASPKLKIEKSSYQTFGASIKHNLTQYNRKDNGIELAVLLAYSRFDLDLFFDSFKLEASNSSAPPLLDVDGIIVAGDMWMGQLLGSKQINKFELFGAMAVTTGDFDFSLSGVDSSILTLLNTQLETLSDTKLGLKGDVGVNYHMKDFYTSSMVTLGNFVNVNLGIHYKI